MLRTRVIPCLLLDGEALVKTTRFRRPAYIGDPVNTARIFNELEVDELVLLDITATRERRRPNVALIAKLASECFMPLAYGGGIRSVDDVRALLTIGMEKVVVNSAAVENPAFVGELARQFGSQCVVVSIDVKRSLFGRLDVRTRSGTIAARRSPRDWAIEAQARGAGELLLTAIDREGTWNGMDLELIGSITSAVTIPVVAHGGAGCVADLEAAVMEAGASAVALGSMVVFQGKGLGVLVNFPDREQLDRAFSRRPRT